MSSQSGVCRDGICRDASHAGSWYEAKGSTLSSQLTRWLDDAKLVNGVDPATVRAIISPHAGYSYSGPTAAYSFQYMKPETIKRVFILGPSHHHHTRICELSSCSTYATPITPLELDRDVITALHKTGAFDIMTTHVDEAEHSIEMQLPYIAQRMKGYCYTIIPILVGALSLKSEASFGKILAPYLDDPDNFFVISSDFCHWGSRFSYQHYNKEDGEIWQSIEALDRVGMSAIESQDVDKFANYQQTYHNTICGRHPIGVLLQAINQSKLSWKTQFVHYAQSSRCRKQSDSSVSYAAAIVTRQKLYSPPPRQHSQIEQ